MAIVLLIFGFLLLNYTVGEYQTKFADSNQLRNEIREIVLDALSIGSENEQAMLDLQNHFLQFF